MEKKTTKEIVDLFKDIHPYNWGMNKKAYDDFNNYKNTEWVRVEDVLKVLGMIENEYGIFFDKENKYPNPYKMLNKLRDELSQSSEVQDGKNK